MKNIYCVKKIVYKNGMNINSFEDAFNAAETKYAEGLDAVWEYCGGKLKRERAGYSGRIGNVEYIVWKVS